MFNYKPHGVPLTRWRSCVWIIFSVLFCQVFPGTRAEFSYEAITAILSRITVSYLDPLSKEPRSITAEIGRFADGAVGPAGGVLINPKQSNFTTSSHFLQGCDPQWAKNAAPKNGEPWVALLLRGGCTDAEKVRIAMSHNASAVLLFGGDSETYLQKESKFKGNAIVVYLLRRKGEQLSYLMMNGTKVYLSINRGQEVKFRITSINRTSVLFVSVSFIVLMVVSLAWLIFYYIQRFRYINAKDKLARHLCTVAKKALAKVPVRNIKNNDTELAEGECCAVCIEQYQTSETIRVLPCTHQFHKLCVDPWLLEHRTCPMCKMDILKYFGYISNTEGSDSSRRSNNNSLHAAESGSRDNSSNRDLPSSRTTGSHNTPQVSVISRAEVSFGTESSAGGVTSSHPVGGTEGAPTFRQPNAGFGATTTAVIRSMINSARPRVSPLVHKQVASKVKDIGSCSSFDKKGSANSSGETKENSRSSSECSSRVSSSISLASSDSQENNTILANEDSSPSSLSNSATSQESSSLTNSTAHESSLLMSSAALNSAQSCKSQATCAQKSPSSQSSGDNVVECDIEDLVKEIMELDSSEEEIKTINSPHSSNYINNIQTFNEKTTPVVAKNPESDYCPAPSIHYITELPAVEVVRRSQSNTHSRSSGHSVQADFLSSSYPGGKHSGNMLDSSLSSMKELSEQEGGTGEGQRPTSSHQNNNIVAISHS